MPRENPYYNPIYAEAAGRISEGLFGNPEKAGAIAYNRSQTQLNNSKTTRQDIENAALSGGLADAIAAGGQNPADIAAAMPQILQSFAAAGVNNPGNFTAPWWGISAGAQSGAPPAEALARAAYIGRGAAVPKDLALTPERQDAIRNDEQAADLARAVAVAQIRGASSGGGKAPKPPGFDDIGKVINSILADIPGATFRDQYARPQLEDSAINYLSETGLFNAMRNIASQNYGGGSEAARQAVIDALDFPPGTRFDPAGRVVDEGWANGLLTPLRILPGQQGPQAGPAFVTPDGTVIDLSRILGGGDAPFVPVMDRAPVGPAAPSRDQIIMELQRRGRLPAGQ